jgi:hypothetical protein
MNDETKKLLDESTKVAQTAAQTIGGNFKQGVGFSPITSESLSGNTAPINLPQTTQNTSQIAGSSVQGLTEGLNTGIQGMISAEDAKIVAAQKATETSTTKTQSFIDKLMGKGQAQVQAETTAGIPEKTQALTDITNEYNTKALEYRRMEESVMKEGLLTDVQKNQKLREISRVKNTELADIGIKQAVAQNNLSVAQQLVDRKIDLEYGDLKDIIGYQTNFLEMNRADLTKAEQNALNLKITENERIYETGKSIGEFAKQVAANGADAGTISRVSSAKTMAEAITAAGQYAGDVLDRQIKQEQLNKLYNENAKLRKEADNMTNGGAGEDLTAYASQYADTGKLPSPAELKLSGLSVGQVTSFAKQLPKPNGALVSTNTGTKSSALSTAEQDGIIALSEIVQKTLPSLKDKFGSISTGLLGGIGGKIWSSQDRQDYLTFRAEFLSKLLVARSGAAVTEQEYARYAALLPTTFNQPFFLGSDGLKKLSSLETSMTTSLNNVLNSKQQSIYGYSKVKIGGVDRIVGEVIDIGGVQYKVLPDGTLTDII